MPEFYDTNGQSYWTDPAGPEKAQIARMEQELTRLRSDLADALAALEPFAKAKVTKLGQGLLMDNGPTFENYEAARQALSKHKQAG